MNKVPIIKEGKYKTGQPINRPVPPRPIQNPPGNGCPDCKPREIS